MRGFYDISRKEILTTVSVAIAATMLSISGSMTIQYAHAQVPTGNVTGPDPPGPSVPAVVFHGSIAQLPHVKLWQPGEPVKGAPGQEGENNINQTIGAGAAINTQGGNNVASGIQSSFVLLLGGIWNNFLSFIGLPNQFLLGAIEQLQPHSASAATQFTSPVVNFPGIPATGCTPPDTVGDVGPNHYIQAVNCGVFQIFSKTGTTLGGPSFISSIWASAYNQQGRPSVNDVCKFRNDGDAIVQYDHLSNRWLISQFALPLSNGNKGFGPAPWYECVAISQTSNPLPIQNWYLYNFTTGANPSESIDYPKMGVWPDAYYMNTNCCDAWALDWIEQIC